MTGPDPSHGTYICGVLVDLPWHHVDVPIRRKGVSAAARVVGTEMLGCDPKVRRRAIQFPR